MKEKNQYGSFTLKDVEKSCKDYANQNNIVITSSVNVEGELVTQIQNARNSQDGLIINAGGYIHTLR